MVDTRRLTTPPTRTRALVIGESLIDIVHDDRDGDQPQTREHPGGSPMNASIGLARQGIDVQFVTELGADQRGDLLEERLVREGVDLLVPMRAGTTSTAIAHLRADGSAEYSFDLDWSLGCGMPDHRPVDVLHFGSLAAAMHTCCDDLENTVRDARATATISYDPNIRPAHDTDPVTARIRVERQAGLSDIVKASDEDVAYLYGDETHIAIAQRWIRRGACLAIITRAADGALLVTAEHIIDLPGYDGAVEDTIGAGDAMTAGLIAGLGIVGLLGADRREQLRRIDERTLRAVGEWAQQTAALTIARPGAEPPTSAETRDAILRHVARTVAA
ncbi:carbohydrate kinase [Microcella alkalica]|uniref:Fructokinase n=1 Tax=Microcella alkalica TaxID=355930 RepID=A0A839E6T8_9MICO|nr:carbohydrate kinase [Microcella alkalica]MBA8846853.1 fructokinase [Microcella alkalica]